MNDSPFVLIVEDHPLFKQALGDLLRLRLPHVSISSVGNAEDAFNFLEQRRKAFDRSVLLLDLGLPDISLPALLDQLKSRFAALPTIILSGSDDPLMVSLCMGAGAKAFVSKLVAPDRIVNLVEQTLGGTLGGPMWLTLDGTANLDDLRQVQLTTRQLEVLHLICQGLTNKQIAEQLEVNEITVKVHVSSIFKELSVSSRTQAILAAQRLGLRT